MMSISELFLAYFSVNKIDHNFFIFSSPIMFLCFGWDIFYHMFKKWLSDFLKLLKFKPVLLLHRAKPLEFLS